MRCRARSKGRKRGRRCFEETRDEKDNVPRTTLAMLNTDGWRGRAGYIMDFGVLDFRIELGVFFSFILELVGLQRLYGRIRRLLSSEMDCCWSMLLDAAWTAHDGTILSES